MGHEKVPHGFGLTGDCGGDAADGAGTEGSLNHRLPLLFLRYGTRTGQRGEGRTVCICGYSKELSYFNEDIKSSL